MAEKSTAREPVSEPTQPPPREGERPKVHLALIARWRLEAHHRCDGRPRPDLPDVTFDLRVAARIARRADLVSRCQGREVQPSRDDAFVGIELGRDRRAREPAPGV